MRILSGPSLRERTTLGIGGRVQAEVCIEQGADWDAAHAFMCREGLSPLILGRGSNLLVQDRDLPLSLLSLPGGRAEVVQDRSGEQGVVVRIPAGTSLPGFLKWLQEHGLAGLEGLAGIPASVGGAVAMNAGSFGQSVGESVHRIQVWSAHTGLIWIQARDMDVTYRQCRLPGLGPVWGINQVEFCLTPGDGLGIKERMQQCLHTKKQTQPVQHRTCGCTFKNPEQAAAGWLLDRCGLRGARCGDMSFSAMHANFLVNAGQGSFAQAWELISRARESVLAGYGLDLDLEVQIVDPRASAS